MPFYTRASAVFKQSSVAARKVRLADPLEVFIARCEARAHLVMTGDLELQEAVDGLQAGAIKLGLVEKLGQDAVQALMADAFGAIPMFEAPAAPTVEAPVEDTPADPDDEYISQSFAAACRLADAARGPVPTPPPCPLVREHGVPGPMQLQQEYERTMAAHRARHGPAWRTLMAAEYLLRVGDSERWRVWLAGHSAAERLAIADYLSKPKPKREQENGRHHR
jgi:hypothetical protein